MSRTAIGTGVRAPALAWPRVGAATFVEAVAVVVLVAVLLIQLLTYPTTEDPDPDGFVSYANHLLQTGTLMPSRRLPGYPVFLAAVARLAPAVPLHEAVYWAQFGLTVLFTLGVWAWARRRFGALVALCLLGIVAAPSYFARMAVLMLADGPYSMLMLPLLLGIGWWVLAAMPRGGWLWLPLLGLATFVLHATRPTTFMIVALYLPALLIGLLVQRRFGRPDGAARLARFRPALARAGALLAIAVLVLVASDRFLDTGARAFNAELIAYRIVTQLPAAGNSAAERRIDEGKRRFQRIEGQKIEEARFGAYEKYNMHQELRAEDVQAVWRARLLAHPAQYAGVVLTELKLGHYMLARHIVPYFLDLTRFSLFSARYPRNDGTPEGDRFRSTGLVVLDRRAGPAHYPLEVDTTNAVLQLVVAWGLLGLGAWRLWSRDGAIIVGLVLLVAAFLVAVAATNTLDARYLLPFAMPIYLGQAVGVAWIAQTLAGRAARPL